jgi:hypothetical protein
VRGDDTCGAMEPTAQWRRWAWTWQVQNGTLGYYLFACVRLTRAREVSRRSYNSSGSLGTRGLRDSVTVSIVVCCGWGRGPYIEVWALGPRPQSGHPCVGRSYPRGVHVCQQQLKHLVLTRTSELAKCHVAKASIYRVLCHFCPSAPWISLCAIEWNKLRESSTCIDSKSNLIQLHPFFPLAVKNHKTL